MLCENWPEDVESDLTCAEKEVRQFCRRRQADERKSLRAFSEVIINGTLPSLVKGVERSMDLTFYLVYLKVSSHKRT